MDSKLNFIFNESSQAILLPLKRETVDLSVVKNFALAENLLPKHEFHITIIGRETGEILLKEGIDFSKIIGLAKSIDWNFALNQEFYFISKEYPESEKRESIIQIVELPGLLHFYQELNKLTGQDFAVPLSHITLYTNSTREENRLRGIGIYSRDDIQSLAPRILVL